MTALRPLLFNPVQAQAGELEATMVARQGFVDELEQALRADAGGTTVRHWLIVAPRGSGKSHLVEVLARRMRGDAGWSVVRLPEEAYRVRSVADLLAWVVGALEGVERPFSAESDATRIEALAEERLRRWRNEHGPVLVILENLAEMLERRFDRREQARLRAVLMGDPPFALVATSVRMTDAVRDHGAPFYDFFQERRLEELSREQVAELIQRRAEWEHASEILDHPEEVRPRVLALHHLSGGNPRLTLALYGVLRAGVQRDIYDQLLQLLDDVTAYYQARLADCSPQGEHLLSEMAMAAGPLVPSELGRRCRMKTNQVTAVLKQLADARFVRPGGRPEDKRARYWEVTDRLFRIWLQMREQGDSRGTIRWIVEFYQGWYAGHLDELTRDASRHVREAWGNGQWDDLARTLRHMEEAFSHLKGGLGIGGWNLGSVDLAREPGLRVEWERRRGPERLPLALPLGLCLVKRGAHAEALQYLEMAVDAGDGHAMVAFSRAAAKAGELERALQRLRALSPDSLWAKGLVLSVLCDLGRFDEAEAEARLGEEFEACAFSAAVATAGRPELALPFRERVSFDMTDQLGPGWIFARFVGGETLSKTEFDALAGWLATRFEEAYIYQPFSRGFAGAAGDDKTAARLEDLIPRNAVWAHAVVRAVRRVRAESTNQMFHADLPYPLRPDEVRAMWGSGGPPVLATLRALSAQHRGASLLLYVALVSMNLLPPDLPVWSDALRVSQAADREAALSALHPEMREAVELLLTDLPVSESTPAVAG